MNKNYPKILLTIIAIGVASYAPALESSALNGKSGQQLFEALSAQVRPHITIADTDRRLSIARECQSADNILFSLFDPALSSGYHLANIIPASYYGALPNAEIAADLNLLTLSTMDATEHRGASPPGVVETATWSNGSLRVGTTKIASTNAPFYEPEDSRKGDVARMMMYAMLCYYPMAWQGYALNIITPSVYPFFNNRACTTFMQWHRLDPPDRFELRGDSIREVYQGNYNPFVRHPELAEYFWGSKKGESYIATGTEPPSEHLKPRYSLAKDSLIVLSSPWIPKDAVWQLDGKKITGNEISVKSLSLGIHTLRFSNASCRGIIKIEVTK